MRPISDMVKKRDNDCSAFVIACYSDPGLHAAREITTKPVLGIAECGILTAMTLGQRFGVISILKKSIPRHLRYVGQMGVADRMAGDRAIGLGVVELSDEARTFSRMAEVAAELRDEDGADVLVMGCAGMARYRDRLQRHVGLPVVEPSQAAVVDGDRPVAPRLVGLTGDCQQGAGAAVLRGADWAAAILI